MSQISDPFMEAALATEPAAPDPFMEAAMATEPSTGFDMEAWKAQNPVAALRMSRESAAAMPVPQANVEPVDQAWQEAPPGPTGFAAGARQAFVQSMPAGIVGADAKERVSREKPASGVGAFAGSVVGSLPGSLIPSTNPTHNAFIVAQGLGATPVEAAVKSVAPGVEGLIASISKVAGYRPARAVANAIEAGGQMSAAAAMEHAATENWSEDPLGATYRTIKAAGKGGGTGALIGGAIGAAQSKPKMRVVAKAAPDPVATPEVRTEVPPEAPVVREPAPQEPVNGKEAQAQAQEALLGRKSWQMKRSEYVDPANESPGGYAKSGLWKQDQGARESSGKRFSHLYAGAKRHKADVQAAAEAGLPVPPEVLADYPDIKIRGMGAASASTIDNPQGRPDLANPGESQPVRALVDQVDQARNAAGEPRVRSDADVKAEADALASNPQAVAEHVLDVASKGGQLSDTNTLAAKAVVNKVGVEALADPAKLPEAMNLIDAYRSTGSEQARAFRQRFDPMMSPAERMRTEIVDQVFSPPEAARAKLDAIDAKIKNATPARKPNLEKRRAKLVQQEAERIAALSDILKKHGIDTKFLESGSPDLSQFANASRIISTFNASTGAKVKELWRNFILSATITHARNIGSNAVFTTFEYGVRKPIGATINLAVRDPNSPQFRDIASMRFAGEALSRASRNMIRAWRDEIPILESDITIAKGQSPATVSFGTKLDNTRGGQAISGKLGRTIRVPQRSLGASDEFFKGMVGTIEAATAASRISRSEGLKGSSFDARVRQLLDDYASPAWEHGMVEAERLTFQSPLGKIAKSVMSVRDAIPGGEFLLPFIKTPTNIAKQGFLENSPIKLVTTAGRAIASPVKGYDRTKLVNDLTGSVVGASLLYGLSSLVAPDEDGRPRITGTRKTDKGQRELDYRSAPPTSIRVGDTWYDYSGIEPIATMLATAADIASEFNEVMRGKEPTDAFLEGVGTIKRQVRDKTFLKSIGDVIELIDSSESIGSKAATMGKNFVTSFVPNLIRQTARAQDDTLRDTSVTGKTAGELAKSAAESAVQEVTGGGDAQAKVDLWGREIKRGGNAASRMLSPVEVRSAETDKLDTLIRKWNAANPNEKFAPTTPGRTISKKVFGKMVEYTMTDQEYHDFLVQAGTAARERLGQMGLNYDSPKPIDIQRIKRAIEAARESARAPIERKLIAAESQRRQAGTPATGPAR